MVSRESLLCSVIVRAYNEEEHIGRLLTGVLQQSVRAVEVILVDSGSTDATLAIASRFPVRVVTIDPSEFTFGRSLNLGCREAGGQYLVFASAHVYPVYTDWLERLLEPFEDERVALVYGKQRGGESTRFSEHQHFAKVYPDRSVARQDHPFSNNANLAIRRELWERRPYDETLPGLEDLAWAQWALSAGYFLAYSAEAEVIHIHNESAAQVYNRYRREAIALKRIMPSERFRLWDFVRLYVSNALSDMWHATQEKVFRSAWRSILWFRFLHLWGTYRGFAHRGTISSELKQAFYYPRSIAPVQSDGKRLAETVDYGAAQREVREQSAHAD